MLNKLIAGFAKNYPLIRGRDFLVRNLKKRGAFEPLVKSLPNPCRTRSGVLLHLLDQDYTSDLIRLYGDYEPQTYKEILGSLRSGEIFIDVGANVGLFTTSIAKNSEGVKVLAFEPNPRLRELLTKSIQENQLESQIQLFSEALSDEAGESVFKVEEGHSGKGHLANGEGELGEGSGYTVKTIRLDDHPSMSGCEERVGLIKIDVEGAEMKVLAGLEGILKRDRPRFIVEGYDHQLKEFGSSCEELKSWFSERGYGEWRSWDGNYYFRFAG